MSYVLKECSSEQNNILEKLNQNNLIVDSVAGSGKTTSILHIAKKFISSNILCLTYNAKLKIETRDKIKDLNLTNIEAHSYHSFCVRYYSKKAYNDVEIMSLIKKEIIPKTKLTYNIIIIDEAQDLTPLYYELVYKILSDNSTGSKLCLLGDRYQSIYDFNKADGRFLTFADKIFQINDLNWSKVHLSESFRLNQPMANFINKCVIASDRIISNKESDFRPRYLLTDAFGDSYLNINYNMRLKKSQNRLSISNHTPFDELKFYLDNGYEPSDIFILAPSIKNLNSPARKLENKIKTTLQNIPIYVPTSDDEKLDEEILYNKLVFSTYHQAKGLERKIVIVFGFDNSYFEFFKKDSNPKICPNEIYVAITRASEHLSLIHHYENEYLPFLKANQLPQYVEYVSNLGVNSRSKSEKISEVSVTDLVKHLPQDVISECLKWIVRKQIRKRKPLIKIDSKTEQKYGFENVGEITGTAIPSYYEFIKKNKMIIFDSLLELNCMNNKNQLKDNKSDDDPFLDNISNTNTNTNITKQTQLKQLSLENIELSKIKPNELLYISNLWTAYKSGYIFKLDQITNYDWLSESNLMACINRLENLNISSNADFEKRYSAANQEELSNRKINGYFDCVDKVILSQSGQHIQQIQTNIYEFKCTSELTDDHFLQLAVYMYMHKLTLGEENKNHKIIKSSNEEKKPIKYRLKYTGYIIKILPDNYYIVKTDGKNHKIKLKTQHKLNSDITYSVINSGHIVHSENEYVLVQNINDNTINMIKIDDIINLDQLDQLDQFDQLNQTEKLNNYYLYNILTDELYELESSLDNLKQMIEYLIDYKYLSKKKTSDEQFINQTEKISNKYLDV